MDASKQTALELARTNGHHEIVDMITTYAASHNKLF
jgi:hypothetical protein